MTNFFNDFFLEGSAIYTLFGSKPISVVTIVAATEAEWINSLKEHWQGESEPRKGQILKEIQDYAQTYDLHLNWEKWIEWTKSHPISNFLFLTQPTESKHLVNAYVMNVRETIWTLQKNYSLVSRVLKTEFDPLEVALDFTNPQSNFWSKIFSNPLLEGILFGYGERNSYFFSLESKKTNQPNELCLFHAISSGEMDRESSKNDLRIPLFRSYPIAYEEDPIIMKYKEERKQIQNRLKEKDFTQEILNRLYTCQ